MRLFFVNTTDWVAGLSEEQVVEYYEKEFDTVDEIEELPKENWKDRQITIIDDPDIGEDEEPRKTNFAELMEYFSENDLPLIVASTEW